VTQKQSTKTGVGETSAATRTRKWHWS